MCGIFGAIGYDDLDQFNVDYIKDRINSRGPDCFSIKKDPEQKFLFAHSRLSIQDLSSSGTQPMSDNITGNIIIFNGEIYNHQELKTELEGIGINFNSKTDTEVILKAYAAWGVDIVNKLVGMFAFSIWDAKSKFLFVARDRLGEKPLYYSLGNDNKFIYSSNLFALLADKQMSREICHQSLAQYLRTGYQYTENCILKAVKKLPPAHYMIVSNGLIIKEVEYWKLENFFKKKTSLDFEASKKKVMDLIKNAVKGQLCGDVPLGIFLSGGVDSGIISSTALSIEPKLNTFSAGFSNDNFDERKQAKAIASSINSVHQDFCIGKIGLKELIEPYEACDEPFGDTSVLPTYLLSKIAKEKITIALTGDGGDEIFLGYPTYQADNIYLNTKKLPRILFKKIISFARLLPVTHKKVGFDYKFKALMNGLTKNSFHEAHETWREIFSTQEINELLIDKFKNTTEKNHTTQKIWQKTIGMDFLDQAAYFDIKTWLVDDILFKIDRMTMAHSLESRAPFLDHRLVEFSASLPSKYKIFKGQLKYIEKVCALTEFDLNYFKSKKLGFNSPMSQYIYENKLGLEEYILSTSIFSKAVVKQLFKEHISKKNDNNFKISTIIGLSAWMKSFERLNKETLSK